MKFEVVERGFQCIKTCSIWMSSARVRKAQSFIGTKVETPIHDNIRELVTWECKEHGVKS
jgi:hypothetical protein